MKRIGAAIMVFLSGLAMFFKLQAATEKNKRVEQEKNIYKEVIDDVHTAQIVEDNINNNPSEFERVRRKFTRK